MKIYRIRIISDEEGDIFRDIEVKDTISLEELHLVILQSFGFEGLEMASFYKSDNQWNQNEEIPLITMEEDGIFMKQVNISEVLSLEKDKLIYVYDYLNMWMFFVELVKIISSEKDKKYPFLLFSKGKLPDSSREKVFKSKKENEMHFGSFSDYDEDVEDTDFDDNDYEEY